jgi:hypothetical protein
MFILLQMMNHILQSDVVLVLLQVPGGPGLRSARTRHDDWTESTVLLSPEPFRVSYSTHQYRTGTGTYSYLPLTVLRIHVRYVQRPRTPQPRLKPIWFQVKGWISRNKNASASADQVMLLHFEIVTDN